jgi:Subtilase family
VGVHAALKAGAACLNIASYTFEMRGWGNRRADQANGRHIVMEPRSLFFRWVWPIAVIALVSAALPAHAGVSSAEARKAVADAGARPRAVGAPGARSADTAAQRKLDGSLREIGQRYPALVAGGVHALRVMNPTVKFQLLATESIPRVLIDAVADRDAQALQTALERLGFQATGRFANDVGGWLPVNELVTAAAIGELRLMRASRPRTRAGAVMTQGDFAQRSDLVRSSTNIPGLNGTGVMVGVISDSFNCYAEYRTQGVPVSGFTGYATNGFTAEYAQDMASGDLPSNVDVLEEADCPNYDPSQLQPFSDEGRAMLQLVHDIAPNARLAFHTAEMSEADFANGIVALAKAGARVIVDDISYADEPFFQDGLVAQAVNQVNLNSNVAYFSSAGNDGRNSLEIVAPTFPVMGAAGAPNAGEKLLNFDASGLTTTTTLPVTIPQLVPGEFINFVIEWDQPYITGAPGSPGAASAIDICITASGTTSCEGANAVGQDPVNILTWLNPVTSGGNTVVEQVSIQIGLVSGPAPGLIKLFVQDNGAGATINAFQTNSPTLQGHPGAAGAMAVGAASYFRTPRCGTTPATLESYSSAGGDAILFDTSGHRLSVPVTRNKPDIVAPDGVNNTFLGEVIPAPSTSIPQCQSNVSFPSFFGTSAAAPHAGAVAALLFQARPSATAAQLYTALRSTALDMGSAGFDFDSGNGFIQADAALTQLAAALPAGGGGSGGGPPPPPATSGGGGGSLGVPDFLLLGLAWLLLLRPRALAARGPKRR